MCRRDPGQCGQDDRDHRRKRRPPRPRWVEPGVARPSREAAEAGWLLRLLEARKGRLSRQGLGARRQAAL